MAGLYYEQFEVGHVFSHAITRTVTDGATTSGSPTFTSATAAFVANDVGAPITAHEFGDRTLQVTGTFDSATVVLEGANVSTYTTLTDPQGNSMSKTAAAIEQVMEVPRYTRPNSSGGSGSQSVTVTLFCRRTRK